MLLSFSIDEMRPWIVNGLRELAGEPIQGRVKRQTIRRFGPQYVKKFGTSQHLENLQLDLWWKSRTPGRFKFGPVHGSATRIQIDRPVSRRFFIRSIGDFCPWNAGEKLWYLDGFNGPDEFIDYFVPNEGDVFEGVLFRW